MTLTCLGVQDLGSATVGVSSAFTLAGSSIKVLIRWASLYLVALALAGLWIQYLVWIAGACWLALTLTCLRIKFLVWPAG